MQRDPADRIKLARHVDIEHVAAILHHEHAAVAVEGDRRRLLNEGIGHDQLETIAGLQDELFQLVLGCVRLDGRLLCKVDAGQVLTAASPALGATASRRPCYGWSARRRWLSALPCGRLRGRCRRLRQNYQARRGEREGKNKCARPGGGSLRHTFLARTGITRTS